MEGERTLRMEKEGKRGSRAVRGRDKLITIISSQCLLHCMHCGA